MNVLSYIRYKIRVYTMRPKRYRVLFDTIYQNSCKKIVEIGVFNGTHAIQMIQTASVHFSPEHIYYYGFDLFEELTEELLKSEGSKKPLTRDTIQLKLEKTGANICLFKGFTKNTLPQSIDVIGKADFIFIDGGHSIETISEDWKNVAKMMKKGSVAIFDDYYINNDREIEGLGCQTIVDQLDRNIYEVDILEPMDVFDREWGKLKIKMARVKKK